MECGHPGNFMFTRGDGDVADGMPSPRKLIVHEMRRRCRRWNAATLETCCDDVVILTCVMETPSSVCVLSGQTMRRRRSWRIFLSFRGPTVNEVGMPNCCFLLCAFQTGRLSNSIWSLRVRVWCLLALRTLRQTCLG